MPVVVSLEWVSLRDPKVKEEKRRRKKREGHCAQKTCYNTTHGEKGSSG